MCQYYTLTVVRVRIKFIIAIMKPIAIINPLDFLGFYPSFYLLGIYVGFTFIIFEIYRRKLPLIPLLVVMVWGLIFAIIGSKLFTMTPAEFINRIKADSTFSIQERVYIGWLIGGMIGIKIFRTITGFKFDLFDIFAFALPAGFAMMRIGCLLGGCCFGKPASLPWSISYSSNSPCYNYQLSLGLIKSDATISLPTHPAQVYEAVAMIFIIFLLLYLRNHLRKPGSL